MPKKTFFNLDKKKRERFLKACFDEFSSHDYNTASISLIVKELEIAKGSVYQYFENKKELFFYLIDLAFQEKEKYLSEVSSEKYKSFATWFSANLEAKIKFEKERAMYSKFLDNFYLQKNNPDLKDRYLKTRNKEFNQYLQNVKKYSSSFGKNPDLEKISMLLIKLEEISADFPEISAGKKLSAKARTDQTNDAAIDFLEILKKGILKEGK